MTMALITQKGGESRHPNRNTASKASQRPRAIDERYGLAVTDDSIIFNVAGQIAELGRDNWKECQYVPIGFACWPSRSAKFIGGNNFGDESIMPLSTAAADPTPA